MPQMVFVTDRKGNYPLHIAIQNHQSYDAIHRLFIKSTDAGKIRDGSNNLLLFMLAAVDNWEIDQDQISVTYELLREDPHLVFYA